jgi:hypothetical protein
MTLATLARTPLALAQAAARRLAAALALHWLAAPAVALAHAPVAGSGVGQPPHRQKHIPSQQGNQDLQHQPKALRYSLRLAGSIPSLTMSPLSPAAQASVLAKAQAAATTQAAESLLAQVPRQLADLTPDLAQKVPDFLSATAQPATLARTFLALTQAADPRLRNKHTLDSNPPASRRNHILLLALLATVLPARTFLLSSAGRLDSSPLASRHNRLPLKNHQRNREAPRFPRPLHFLICRVAIWLHSVASRRFHDRAHVHHLAVV